VQATASLVDQRQPTELYHQRWQALSRRCRRTTSWARIADLAPDSRWRADRRLSLARMREALVEKGSCVVDM